MCTVCDLYMCVCVYMYVVCKGACVVGKGARVVCEVVCACSWVCGMELSRSC